MKRSMKLAALAASSMLALAACGSDDGLEEGEDGLTKLTVYQITTTDSTPLYLGIQEGFFEEEGLDVEVKIAQSGSAIIPSVVNGESPIGYANVVSDLAAIDQGLDIKFVSSCCGVGSDPDESTWSVRGRGFRYSGPGGPPGQENRGELHQESRRCHHSRGARKQWD